MSIHNQDPSHRLHDGELPPLEPTAEVPPIHSDKLNDPAYWNDKLGERSAKVPREHRDDKNKMKTWKKPVAAMAAAAAALAGAGVAYSAMHHDGSSASGNLDPSKKDTDALKVNGNQHPEKANPDYDKQYGIYSISADGQLENPDALAKKFGLVRDYHVDTKTGVRITQTGEQIKASGDYDALNLRNKIFNDTVVPNMTAAVNAINMNNPEVQQARAVGGSLSQDESLLLQNADVEALLTDFFTSTPNPSEVRAVDDDIYAQLVAASPNDAGLRAVVCPFGDGETKPNKLCLDAEKAAELNNDELFFHFSTFTEHDTPEGVSDSIDRQVSGDLNLGIAWADQEGKLVSYNRLKMPINFHVVGEVQGQEQAKGLAYISGQ